MSEMKQSRTTKYSIARRCSILSILGAVLGMLAGGVVWIQTPPQYKAIARFQIITSGVPIDELQNSRRANAILSSEVVLRNAIEIGRLTSNPKLSHKKPAELMAWLRSNERLNVKPATKVNSTNIINVSFRCDDQELSAEVATAIVSGFEKLIQCETQTVAVGPIELNTVSLGSKSVGAIDKHLKRIEVPTQGFPDGPWLGRYLAGGGIIGACLFAVSSILLYRKAND